MIKLKIINGKKIAEKIYINLAKKVNFLKEKCGVLLKLAVVCVGKTGASSVYISCKKKACQRLGIVFEEYFFEETSSEDEIVALINELNNRSDITGIIVQLSLPKHLNSKKILGAINEKKDIDALTPKSLGNLMFTESTYNFTSAPCTALAILEILKHENVNLEGKHVVILGKSIIVGKPLAMMLLNMHATVTVCHSKTRNLSHICKMADIIISATGVKNIITKEMVHKNSVVIDAGIVKNSEGAICGDVDFKKVSPLVSLISPVPGGVGPATVAMLLKKLVCMGDSLASASKGNNDAHCKNYYQQCKKATIQ